jgi:hypothetical protein
MFQAFWRLVILVFRMFPEVCFWLMCGYGFGPRVAAGVARGSTVRHPACAGVSSFLTVPILAGS